MGSAQFGASASPSTGSSEPEPVAPPGPAMLNALNAPDAFDEIEEPEDAVATSRRAKAVDDRCAPECALLGVTRRRSGAISRADTQLSLINTGTPPALSVL